jgi:hypothetical protein
MEYSEIRERMVETICDTSATASDVKCMVCGKGIDKPGTESDVVKYLT